MEKDRKQKADLMELSPKAAKAWQEISVVANSAVGRKRIRATSRATFPLTEVKNCLAGELHFTVPILLCFTKL